MTEERDPYRTLGVSSDAPDSEIRKAYHARARRLHPDVVGEAGLDEMRELNQAWSLLKDPERRATFDAGHGHRRTGGGDSDSSNQGASAGAAQGGSRDFGSQPRWTGAAGPPPGRPWGSVLNFGIYAGWSLGEIGRRDRGYLAWLRDRPEGKALRTEIERLLEMTVPTAQEASSKDSRKSGRRGR